MLTVTVVGSSDQVLLDLLRAASMRAMFGDETTLNAWARAGAKLPDVIMVDARGGAGVPRALAAVRRQHPAAGIVIVAEALDPTLLLEAMRAGVNEVVPEPVTSENLSAAISRVGGQRAANDPGQIYAFVGAKGGVGTTTVAVNIAASLAAASKKRRVLLIDLHQGGGDASVFLGAEPRFSIKDALENTHRLDETFMKSLVVATAPNLDLLASPDTAMSIPIEASKLRKVIDAAANIYGHTVLDLPGTDGAVLDSLDHVARIVLVANQELATVKSASRLAATLFQRYGREKISMVLSRSDRQADIGHEDVERVVGVSIVDTFPSDYRAALHALNTGRPLAIDSQSELSGAFKRFAGQLSGTRHEQPIRATRSGFLGLLSTNKN